MDVYREELFGPAGVVCKVADEDEAVAIANDTTFGLGSYVYTTDEEQAARVADKIVATGDGPFDVVHHANTSDRALEDHMAGPSAPGRFAESWVDLLIVKGFDAGQPIVYISTDAGQPLTAVLERSTYVPALDKAAYNGGDDFLGSARERLFGFINGQAGANNTQSQGFVHLVKDGTPPRTPARATPR